MRCRYLRILTEDNIELQGLLFEPIEKYHVIVLHLHGLAGNFYENRFLDYMAEEYTKRNVAFLSVNLRGHDYISDLLKDEGSNISYVRIGGAYETLEESVLDINGWIKFIVNNLKITNVILQGHSTGAIKVLYYMVSEKAKYKDVIRGLILLSPSDDIGIQKDHLGLEEYNKVLDYARQLIKNGKELELLPLDIFFGYPLSAKTYVNMFDSKSFYRVLELTNKNSLLFAKDVLAKIYVPVFIIYGEEDEAVRTIPQEYIKILKELLKNSPDVDGTIIGGASHSYLGYEDKVAKEVAQWVDQIVRQRKNL